MLTQLEVRRINGDPEKAPMLFLHGAWMGAWCWADWMDFFNARGHTVVAPSYRAHGGSSGRARLRWTRLSEYVEDATSVLRSFEVPPIVIAHSMGGAVAGRLLETQTASAVVLVASVPSGGALGATWRLARHHPLVFLNVNLRLSLRPAVSTPQLVRELFYNPSTPEAIVQNALNCVQDESYTAFLGMLAFRAKPLPVSLPKLVIGGERDGLFTPAEIRVTAQFHNAALKLYADLGHNLMLEENNVCVAQDIAHWLEGHGL